MSNDSNFSMNISNNNNRSHYLYRDNDVQALAEQITFYVMGVGAICICCLGIVGNTLSLVVLTKKTMRHTTTYNYLTALAVSDTLVLIFTILTALKDTRPPLPNKPQWMAWQDMPMVPQIYPVSHAFAIMFQVTSIWLTVAFTLDRYIMICHPFFAEVNCTTKLSRCIILFVALFSIIYGIPRFFENSVYHFSAPAYDNGEAYEQNTTFIPYVWHRLSAFGDSFFFKNVYHIWSWIILVASVPLVSISIMNIFLIVEVRRLAKRHRSINPSESSRQDINVMLIGVIFIFIFCQLPAAVSHIIWGFQQSAFNLNYFIINEIGNIMVILNSAINFLPYIFFGKKFRQEFMKLFFRRASFRNNENNQYQLDSSKRLLDVQRSSSHSNDKIRKGSSDHNNTMRLIPQDLQNVS